ncbi:MAG TPA: hypothetical protein VJ927_06580 [Actinomycetota bacterium]|nr:hypothetical protein [Actinomycetota bacterium]
MRRVLIAAITALMILPLAPSGAAKTRFVELGTDPAGDGVPALDVTYLQVGKTGSALEIRIGIDKMLPVVAGYPDLPGIEWVFDVKGRRFIAEAVASADGPLFFLFEEKDGAFEQLESPEGTYDPADGYASIIVPLKTIGAKSGVKISGADGLENGDVDAHVHLLATTVYPDGMQTTKDYVVP